MVRTTHEFDLVIIGAGTAGLSAMHEAKKHTNNILMIHDGPKGTKCALTGCMPSKLFIHAAELYHGRLRMEEAGIHGADMLHADIPLIFKRVQKMRDDFVASVLKGMAPFEKNIIYGRARFEGANKLRVNGRVIHAKNIVVATGSTPRIPSSMKDIEDRIITTDSFFNLKDLPERIGVIGMGPEGTELAQALARLGMKVTAINKNECIGHIEDKDICKESIRILSQDMKLWIKTEIEAEPLSNGAILLRNGKQVSEVDKLLVCTGSKPNLSGLRLDKLSLPMDEEDVPHYNCYTGNIPGTDIYLAGDVSSNRALLHEAVDEGQRAAYYALTGDKSVKRRHVRLAITFMHPNLAQIGEYDLDEPKGRGDIITGCASYRNQGRARVEQRNEGLIRIYADAADGRLRGAEMLAPDGEHLAHLLVFAMEKNMTAQQMLEMPFYHPTIEEGVETALKDILSQMKNGQKKAC